MHKKLAGGLLAGMALVAAACGSSAKTTTPTTTTPTTKGPAATTAPTSAAAKHYKVTLIVGTTSDAFYVSMNCGAKAEAAKLGVGYSYTGPAAFQASEQIPIVHSVTAEHPNAVLIAPTDVTALIAPMESMKAAGIKLVEVDTTVNNNTIAVSRISSNNLLGGKMAADALAAEIHDKGTVMVINVNPGISTTDARNQGFREEMKAKYPNIKLLATQYDNDEPGNAAQIVTSTYASHPSLNGVFAANVLTAEGVATGVKEANATGKIKDVSFDAEPADISDLNSGVINALIAQEPAVEGSDGVQQAVNALEGKHVTPVIGTGLVEITKANEAKMNQYFYKSSC